jgi:flagellar basal body-associated protein FliL
MKILIWIIVALIIVGGLVWFMSGDSTTETESSQNQATEVTEESSIESDEQVLAEIDNALQGLE